MRKSEREVRGQASDEGEQEAGEWWGRARHRRMMGKSRRDTQLRECKRQASDGVETCRRDTQLTGEANDGEEQER